MAELELYEYEQLDPKWNNKCYIPLYNAHINKYYAKSTCNGKIIKRSYSNTLRELRRKMKYSSA